jgi:predicted transcriptional regulator of viral defense system
MTRSIPPALAGIVEILELERPATVTPARMQEVVEQAGASTPPRVAIQRLAERGWLLRTGMRGVWEFAPADRAGAFSEGGPMLTVRAVLESHPDRKIAVALGSALWLHDLADRAPEIPEIALPIGERAPRSVSTQCRVVHHDARLAPVIVKGVPVHRPATVLVHLAEHPSDVRSWGGIMDLLPALARIASPDEVMAELSGRSHATHIRLAYLLEGLPEGRRYTRVKPAGKVWFGPRAHTRRNSARWNVADTLLPFAPSELGCRK